MLVLAVHLYLFFITMSLSPIGFDEGFNLQAPLNLVQGHGYTTEDWLNGGPRIPFDAVVSTGPIVELPVALSFLVFGVSISAARIVMLPYLLLLITSLFILGRRIAGRWAGLLAAAAVLALNTRADFPFTVIYGSSDALGEFAAAALIAFALVLFPRHRLSAGLVLGFAALAKFIAFMAVPAFMVALLLVPLAVLPGERPRRVRELVRFGVLAVVPSVAWELVKLVSLGPTGYWQSLLGYMRFVFRSGSGADGSARAPFYERAIRLFSAWQMPTELAIVLALFLFAAAGYGLYRYWAGGQRTAPTRFGRLLGRAKHVPLGVWGALGTLAIFFVWWSFIASSTFVRHTMPVLLVTVPVVYALAMRGAVAIQSGTRWLRVVGVAFLAITIGVLTLQTTRGVIDAPDNPDWTRGQQQEAAAFIRSLDVEQVQGINWWEAPALRFLSNVPSTPVGTGTGPLVLEPIMLALDPRLYQIGLDMCVDTLYSRDDFVVCTIDPDTKPLSADA